MNKLTEKLGINYPIIQGGMGNISNASLASAVSIAGGLGMIGTGTMTPNQVEEIILATKERTTKPFGVNIAISVCSNIGAVVDLILKHFIPVVSLSAGNPTQIIPKLKEHGVMIISVVASVNHAKKAEAAGVDILVGEGYEAAGINSHLETTTFALIPQLAQATSLPIVAAGGIGDGRGYAAALMLGASGVQMGTRLIATQESTMHQKYIDSLLQCSDHGTVIAGRSVNKIRRVLPTPYIEKVLGEERKGFTVEKYAQLTSEKHHVNAALFGDFEEGFINGGQIAGLVQDIPTVEELFRRMMKEAKECIENSSLLLK